MKLIYAGQDEAALPFTSLLFNCTRNQNCQREYFVPVNSLTDIVLFADLPAKPDTVLVEAISLCNVDEPEVGSAITYVIGQRPDGSWYGVFQGIATIGVVFNKFLIKFTFTIDGVEHVYYSQQYESHPCDPLKLVRGCYPNETIGSDAEDCNGIYYGLPTTDDFLGTQNFRYFHKAFVRMGSVIEQANTLSFVAFNNKKTYKSTLLREWLFEFELVPTFYKNVLVGIFNRGNVEVAGQGYKLSETQNINITDIDSQLWKMDITFDAECKLTFGCGESDCTLPPLPCDLAELEFTVEADGDDWVGNIAGVIPGGASIDWEVYDRDLALVDSGNTPAGVDFPIEGIDPSENCYTKRYRVNCGGGSVSSWSDPVEFGDCAAPPVYHAYECERYLCSNCSEPLDTIVAQHTNPALTLFKYFKSAASPTTITLRPIATSLGGAIDTMVGLARDTCVQSCGDPPPIEIE